MIDQDVRHVKEVHQRSAVIENVHVKEVDVHTMKVAVHIVMQGQEVAIVMHLELAALVTVAMITTAKGN